MLRGLSLLFVGVALWGTTLLSAPVVDRSAAHEEPASAPVTQPRNGRAAARTGPTRTRPRPHPEFSPDALLDGMDPADMDDMLARCVQLLYRGEPGHRGIVELVRRAEAAGALTEHTFYANPELLLGQALRVAAAHGEAFLRFGLFLHAQAHDSLPYNLRKLRRAIDDGSFGPLVGYVQPRDRDLIDGYTEIFINRLDRGRYERRALSALAQIPGDDAVFELGYQYEMRPHDRDTIVSALYLRGETEALRKLLPTTADARIAARIRHAIDHPRRTPFPADRDSW